MAYQHIVVTTDLTDAGKLMFQRGVALARALNAKLSLIYVEVHHEPQYAMIGFSTEFYHYTAGSFEDKIRKELEPLVKSTDYPVNGVIVSRGELVSELISAIKEHQIDLVIFGHHHDLWSNLFSTTRKAINQLNVDVLVIPLKD